jgi:putative transposase
MSKRKDKIELSETESEELQNILSKGKHSVRKVKRAQILLKLHQGKLAQDIAEAIGVCLATVYNVHDRYIAGKLAALEEQPRPGQPRKVTPEVEAAVTHIACSEAPEGKSRWTVSLINERIVQLGYKLNDESVRLILKKVSSNPGSESSGASVK